MVKQQEILGHPTGLWTLAATELWERMSYYGLRGILVLYLVQQATAEAMGWGSYPKELLENNALNILGWYMMAAYITPILGGWLADRYLGERICIMIGGIMMAAGKFIMAIPFIYSGGMSHFLLILGLCVLALGNGLFKPNISALVGKLYDKNDVRRDAAFTLFYMGINVGALMGFILIGWIAKAYGYHMAFIIAGIGMLIGSLIQGLLGQKTLGDLGNQAYQKYTQTTEVISQKLTSTEKSHIWAIVMISAFAMIFFMIYEQIAGSFMLFTQNNTDLEVMGFSIPPAWILSVNPAFIILLSPIMSYFLAKDFMKSINITHKYAFGFFILCLAFIVAAIAALPLEAYPDFKVSILWPCAAFILITIAELCISPVGLATVASLSPVRLAGLMMGMLFFFLGIGNKLSAELGKFIVNNGQGYFDGFMITACICLGVSGLILMIKPCFNRLINAV